MQPQWHLSSDVLRFAEIPIIGRLQCSHGSIQRRSFIDVELQGKLSRTPAILVSFPLPPEVKLGPKLETE